MTLYLTHGNGEESIPLELPASSSQVEEIDIRLDRYLFRRRKFSHFRRKELCKGTLAVYPKRRPSCPGRLGKAESALKADRRNERKGASDICRRTVE